MSSEEEKKMALVRRFWEAQANADLDTLDELLVPDFVDHSSFAGQAPGREGYKQQVAKQHAALSDDRFVIEDQIAKDDKVVTHITWRSIHDRREYFEPNAKGHGGRGDVYGHAPHSGGQDRRGVEGRKRFRGGSAGAS